MKEYLEWLKEQLKESKKNSDTPYMDDFYYAHCEGEITAYEDAIYELEDGIRYSKMPEVDND